MSAVAATIASGIIFACSVAKIYQQALVDIYKQ
jgi:hypothetical protein